MKPAIRSGRMGILPVGVRAIRDFLRYRCLGILNFWTGRAELFVLANAVASRLI
jgi:hypothetical protein